MYACATCGDIVPSDNIDLTDDIARCARCFQEGRTVKWPGLWVDSSAFGRLDAPKRLHGLSVGYLNSAMCLCNDLGEHPEALDWPRASAVYFCFHHSIELFLKACILTRAPAGEKLHHDVSKLQGRFLELYPDNEFLFYTPWDIGLETIEHLMGGRADVEEFEAKPDQVYRYLAGKDGSSAKALHIFAPGTCFFMLKRLECDIVRVWRRVVELENLSGKGSFVTR